MVLNIFRNILSDVLSFHVFSSFECRNDFVLFRRKLEKTGSPEAKSSSESQKTDPSIKHTPRKRHHPDVQRYNFTDTDKVLSVMTLI